MASRFHDLVAIKAFRVLSLLPSWMHTRNTPSPTLGEMGMFQVDGKNPPPRDIILQLLRCKYFYDFIRTILGIT